MASQSLTHGALIYSFCPSKLSFPEPRGGIRGANVARGDIIQFLEAHFKSKDGGKKWAGAPDHTAVVTDVLPNEVLKVVEQNGSGSKRVKKGSYDMTELIRGEVRIFRAVGESWAGKLIAKCSSSMTDEEKTQALIISSFSELHYQKTINAMSPKLASIGEESFDAFEMRPETTITVNNAPKRPGGELPGEPVAKRAAPNLSARHNEIVIINVGEGEKIEMFTIHKEKLCRYSPWFQVALDNDRGLFVNQPMQTMNVKETTPEVFELFNRLCYRGSITDEENNMLPSASLMIRLWVFGRHIMSPRVQNIAITSLYNNKRLPLSKDLQYIYNQTDQDSPLRKWIIDTFARKMDSEVLGKIIKAKLDLVPKQMLADLVLAQKKLILPPKNIKELKVERYLVDDK